MKGDKARTLQFSSSVIVFLECHAIFYLGLILRHVIKLTGLELNKRYYYQVGVPDNGTSDVMSFFTKDGNPVFAVSSLTDLLTPLVGNVTQAIHLPLFLHKIRTSVKGLQKSVYDYASTTSDLIHESHRLSPIATVIKFFFF